MGQQLYFDSLWKASDPVFTLGLTGPDGANVSFPVDVLGNPLNKTSQDLAFLHLPRAGTYRLTVNGANDVTGPYEFRPRCGQCV